MCSFPGVFCFLVSQCFYCLIALVRTHTFSIFFLLSSSLSLGVFCMHDYPLFDSLSLSLCVCVCVCVCVSACLPLGSLTLFGRRLFGSDGGNELRRSYITVHLGVSGFAASEAKPAESPDLLSLSLSLSLSLFHLSSKLTVSLVSDQ